MTGSDFDKTAHRYLDGESDSSEAVVPGAKRFAEVMERYKNEVPTPGGEVDRAVMASVAGRPGPTRPGGVRWWNWFLRPQHFTLRPAMGFAMLIVALFITKTLSTGGVEETPVAAAPVGTVLVRFEFAASQASQVTLAGSFNEWSDGALPMSRQNGVWTVTVPLTPGEHEYLFVVDGDRWEPDPNAHAQVDDGFGQSNSIIAVGPRGVIRS
jgi:hypothetical protein